MRKMIIEFSEIFLVAAFLAVGAPAAAQSTGSVSSGYLTGVWQENQYCSGSESMVFYPNNTMSSAGSVAANYAVASPSQIVMYGAGGQVLIQAQIIAQNKMVLSFQNDSKILYRCSQQGNRGQRGNMVQNKNPRYFAGNGVIPPKYLAGGWTDAGNCQEAEIFTPDGHFQTSTGVNTTWALFGHTLRLTSQNGSVDLTIQVNGPNNMTLYQNGGGTNYTRCF